LKVNSFRIFFDRNLFLSRFTVGHRGNPCKMHAASVKLQSIADTRLTEAAHYDRSFRANPETP
jgi:hypothetical protein